ncbi:MAG TPA: ABC transporter ATP-binding protein [Devosiaceae bacterium]|jgi:peptide/nickel transport system ATP-binding protein/glutathione transport system ATP-binding protein|nr:ABC transporter ATP-binding protein [Devosiaceae bacterium]
MTENLLSVEDLRVTFDHGKIVAVDGLSFTVGAGECLAIVGESGSGKSVTAMSILGLTSFNGGRTETGSIRFIRRDGKTVDLAGASERTLRAIRGDEIAMIFQEPMTSLNPVFTVGEQIAEVIRTHKDVSNAQAASAAVELIRRVHIPEPERRFGQYPHELSGGMRQRVVIAMALACAPRLLIADEPTTALDVTIQAQILHLVRTLSKESGMAVLFITHDMGVVAEMADRVVVMRHGKKVEEATARTLFAAPMDSYTQLLLASVPRLGSMRGSAEPRKFGFDNPVQPTRPRVQTPLLEVTNLVTRFPVRRGLLQHHVANVHAVDDVSFAIGGGETLALVGESGCGKSTTGRSILRLVQATSGSVTLGGQDLLGLPPQALRQRRRDMQIIFQDPYAALDPRLTAMEQVAEPLVIHGVEHGSALTDRVAGLFRRVGLSEDQFDRYPHEFSGGQRQRLCIARALSLSPKLIVADEPVSALDVSIQAQVVNLLIELQEELGLSYLFISHDMAVVERMSHRVAVMHMGRIVEIGPRGAVFEEPRHAYTRTLLAAVPKPDPAAPRRAAPEVGLLPSPIYPVGHVPAPLNYVEVDPGHFVLAA